MSENGQMTDEACDLLLDVMRNRFAQYNRAADDQVLFPTTGGQLRAWTAALRFAQDRQERLIADIDRLTAERDAANQRAEAAEAGAAALREAAEAAIAYDAAIQGHASEGESWVASDNLDRLYEVWITTARDALANPAGAALLEERQRVGNILGVLMAEVEVGGNVAHPTEAQAGYQAAMAKVVALLTVALQLDEPAPAPGGEQG